MGTELQAAVGWCVERFEEWFDAEYESFEADYYWKAAFSEAEGAVDEYIARLEADPARTLEMARSGRWVAPWQV